MLKINYDRTNDIMYFSLGDKSNSYGDEIVDGFVVMRDIETDEITGFTIFDFIKKYESNNLYSLPLPIPIDFDADVIAKICN